MQYVIRASSLCLRMLTITTKIMKKTVAGATEGRELKKTRRSTRLLSKRTAVQLNKEETERDNKEETEHDDKPEEVTFIQGAAQAKEERQLVTNAAIKYICWLSFFGVMT